MENFENSTGKLLQLSWAAIQPESAAMEEIGDARIEMRSVGLHLPE